VLTARDLADGAVCAPDLDATGRPEQPLVGIDLDTAVGIGTDILERASRAATDALVITVGVTSRPTAPEVVGLSQALTVTLTAVGSEGLDRSAVEVRDVEAGLACITERAAAAPVAAVTLEGVLRQTARLDVRPALTVESAAYSTLLGGGEFRQWLERRGPRRLPSEPDSAGVRVERTGATLSIVLDRPHRRNALDNRMRDALVDALEIAVADPDLAVVISANGPHFSSGGDLDEFGTAEDLARAHIVRTVRSVGWLLHRCRERSLVRVHGECIGAGVEIPAFAGRVEAAAGATFRLPELDMGLVPGAGGTVSVTRRIGRWRTAWLALSGTAIDDARALRWGLVDAVVPR
jgi:hypothetical protein